jgi:hypothetical protein
MVGVAMLDTDEDRDEFEDGTGTGKGNGKQRFRRDNVFYLLSEIERALEQVSPELSREDAATVCGRFCRLVAKVAQRGDRNWN